jgi:hypothetical protein
MEQIETANLLKEALQKTRAEGEGITLNLVARIIVGEFDSSEVEALIRELEAFKQN